MAKERRDELKHYRSRLDGASRLVEERHTWTIELEDLIKGAIRTHVALGYVTELRINPITKRVELWAVKRRSA